MRTTRKKLISLIVAILMVVSILPFGAINVFAALEDVDALSISGVGVPVVGEKPDYNNIVWSSAPYTLEDTVWVDITENREVGKNDKFFGGHQYKVAFTLKIKSGYQFTKNGSSTSVKGSINGLDAEVSPVAGKEIDKYLTLSYTFPELSIISINQVNIAGLERPVMFASPDREVSENGVGYTVKDVKWYDETDETYLTESSIFMGGKVYTVYIEVDADTGYKFILGQLNSSAVGGVINGNATGVKVNTTMGGKAEENVTLSYTFEKLELLPIKYIETSVVIPTDGAHPYTRFEIPTGAGYARAALAVTWTDEEGNALSGSHSFKNGDKYTATVNLRAETGYSFDIYEATMNNQEAKVTENNDGTVSVSCTFTCKSNRVEKVDITIPYAPVLGQHPYFGIESSEPTYLVESVRWFYKNPYYNGTASGGEEYLFLEEDQRFEEGVTYALEMTLQAVEGFIFNDAFFHNPDPEVFINGKNMDEDIDDISHNSYIYLFSDGSDDYDQLYICIYYNGTDFPECGKGELRDVSVDGIDIPTQDYAPDTDIVVGGGQSITKIEWVDISNDDKVLEDGDTFIYGHNYLIRVTVKADEGYSLTTMAQLSATINGNYAAITGYNAQEGEVTFTYAFPVCLPDEVPEIELEGIEDPVHGAEPDFTISSKSDKYNVNVEKNDLTYKNGVAWYDETEGGYLRVGDTLVGGHDYTVYIYVYAEDGYIFFNGAAATIDGNSAEAEAYEGINAEYVLCVKYSVSVAHVHIYDEDGFNRSDDNSHWRECTVENCPDIDASVKDKATHKGGEAICGAQAVCDDCGNSYGAVGDHIWSTDYEKTADGHAKYCTVDGCKVKGEKEAHTPDIDAPTEEKAQKCSVCDYIIAPKLSHTEHTPSEDWEYNETSHWHICTGCEGQQIDKAAHTDGNNDGFCDVCEREDPNFVPETDPADTDTDTDTDTDAATESDTSADTTKPIETADTDDTSDKKDGLGAGAVIAIIIGVIAVLGGGGFAVYTFVIKKKTN